MIGWISVLQSMLQVAYCDDELPVSVARQVLGPEKILGVTAKTVKRALEAETSVQITWGQVAIFPTTTKENAPITLDFNLENHLPNGRYTSSCYWRIDVREY